MVPGCQSKKVIHGIRMVLETIWLLNEPESGDTQSLGKRSQETLSILAAIFLPLYSNLLFSGLPLSHLYSVFCCRRHSLLLMI